MKNLLLLFLFWGSLTCSANIPEPPPPSPPDGSVAGYDYVDLGLPSGTYWASYNMGAETPHDFGDKFAWGEIAPRDYFTRDNYQYFVEVREDPAIGIWCQSEDIGDNICGTQYDAARQIWGSAWRLPTTQERYELLMYCWHKWTCENDVMGVRVYGPNQHNIFLPAAGWSFYDTNPYYNWRGSYWTGELDYSDGQPIYPAIRAKIICVDSSTLSGPQSERCCGYSIRPVINRRELAELEQITSEADRVDISNDSENIIVKGASANSLVSVVDMAGRTILTVPCDKTGVSHILRPALSGLYLVIVTNNGAMIKSQKIAIK